MASPSLLQLLFTVTTLLQGFKVKSLSINSLDLDKVKCLQAGGSFGCWTLSLTDSVTVTSPVIDASLCVFIWLEERYGLVQCPFSISAIPHFKPVSIRT